MNITKEFIDAWELAKKYMNLQPDKRNFSQGVQILRQSGYKPNVVNLLTRKGELDWTREKLFLCLRDVIKLYNNTGNSGTSGNSGNSDTEEDITKIPTDRLKVMRKLFKLFFWFDARRPQ